MKMICLSMGLALLAGCGSPPKYEVDKLDTWMPSERPAALTRKIGIVSDTQFHESRAHPHPLVQQSGDAIFPVTLRSAEQVIGAEDMLEEALALSKRLNLDAKKEPIPTLVLHVGDAMDVSCSSEWRRFQRTMLSQGLPSSQTWLYTPGNHDGYLTGNSYPPNERRFVNENDWVKLCNAGMTNAGEHRPLRKIDLLEAYARLLGPSLPVGKDGIRCSLDRKHCWVIQTSPNAPWESFIVQLAELPPPIEAPSEKIYAILLDSSNYSDGFNNKSISLAAKLGQLLPQQIAAASALRDLVPVNGRYFFLAHHPMSMWRFEKWGSAQRQAWDHLIDDPRSLRFIVTSHTHKGGFYDYGPDAGGVVELNTGSLADPPVYMRTMQFERGPHGEIGFISEALSVAPPDELCKAHISKYNLGKPPSHLRQIANMISSAKHDNEAKHRELNPQLDVYRYLVKETYPAEAKLTYRWPSTRNGERDKSLELLDSQELAKKLEDLAECESAGTDPICSLEEKEGLLLALEDFYRATGRHPGINEEKAHNIRLCLALAAAEESPWVSKLDNIADLRKQIAQRWSMQLSPRAAKP